MKAGNNQIFDKIRVYKYLTENEVIDFLLNWNDDREKSDLRAFLGGIYSPDPDDYFEYEGFYVIKTILRNELKLEKKQETRRH